MPLSDTQSASPFLNSANFVLQEAEADLPELPDRSALAAESPFLAAYEMGDQAWATDPEAEEYVTFLNELYDDEFDDTLFELVTEAVELNRPYESYEHAGNGYADQSRRRLDEHFAPLVREAETLMERLAQTATERDLRSLHEPEIEALFDGFSSVETLSPSFENFFGKLKKAFKKVAKKAVRLAKKGVKAVAKLGLGPLFSKLRAIVRPLLKRVLERAINRLPAQFRSPARKLAKRLPFINELETALEDTEEPIAVAGLQHEFNIGIANLLFADNEAELEMEAIAYGDAGPAVADPVGDLNRARDRFVRQIDELAVNEDAAPYVEQFIPAILPVLRLGLKVTGGRQPVVNYLAKLVAKLIRRYVGSGLASPLSRALVDAGLRLMGLEMTPEQEQRVSATAIASTVEDMVRQVVALPDYVLDDQALLEGFALEAFERSIARNMPPMLGEETYLARPDLRQERRFRGAWVSLPVGPGSLYKKFSCRPKVAISAHKARRIKTFGGVPLAKFFQDQLGLPPGQEVEAEVHLYELLPGTTLPQISRHEQGVAGLGTTDAMAYGQLHPLTREAAGLLLDEPELGQESSHGQLGDRRMVGAGQRCYYLQIPGARLRLAAGTDGQTKMRKNSHAQVVFDFPANQVRIHQYLSEHDAQHAAVKLRRQAPLGSVMTDLMPLLDESIGQALSGQGLKVIHGALAPGSSRRADLQSVPPQVLAQFGALLKQTAGRGLVSFLKEQASAFTTATADQSDGVTLQLTVVAPAGMAALRDSLAGMPAGAVSGDGAVPVVTVQVAPGHERE